MKPPKSTRRRGFVLTPVGLKRLQGAILAMDMAENNGIRFTLDELGDRMNVSSKTLSRLWSLDTGVDQKTLTKLCNQGDLKVTNPLDYEMILPAKRCARRRC